MSNDLFQLRSQLTELNRMMFSLWNQRRQKVAQIQAAKGTGASSYKHYDPKYEQSLFYSFSRQLKAMSPKEILALSLLMEDHAGAGEMYPEWSAGVHLNTPGHSLHHRTNPLLIALRDKNDFFALPLNDSFKFLSEFIDA
jgi:hypothetical protein